MRTGAAGALRDDRQPIGGGRRDIDVRRVGVVECDAEHLSDRAAVTVNGLGVASTCACGGAPGAWRLKMRVDGPLGSMKSGRPDRCPA